MIKDPFEIVILIWISVVVFVTVVLPAIVIIRS